MSVIADEIDILVQEFRSTLKENRQEKKCKDKRTELDSLGINELLAIIEFERIENQKNYTGVNIYRRDEHLNGSAGCCFLVGSGAIYA